MMPRPSALRRDAITAKLTPPAGSLFNVSPDNSNRLNERNDSITMLAIYRRAASAYRTVEVSTDFDVSRQ